MIDLNDISEYKTNEKSMVGIITVVSKDDY